MSILTRLLAFLHCSAVRDSAFVHWLMGEERPNEKTCACKGKWGKYTNTEHGAKYCLRSSHKTVRVYEV